MLKRKARFFVLPNMSLIFNFLVLIFGDSVSFVVVLGWLLVAGE